MTIRFFVVCGLFGVGACGGTGASDDAAVLDGSVVDASMVMDPDAAESTVPSYQLLSETGLYEDFANRVIAVGIQEYEPSFPLWSDGAEKKRWVLLPQGTQIDTSDMDNWKFPVGTKLWKQFSWTVDGSENIVLETRLIEIYGPDAEDVWMGAFSWFGADGTTALADAEWVEGFSFLDERAITIPNRTEPYVVPAHGQCSQCHVDMHHRALGFQALQLSHTGMGGVDLVSLAAAGILTAPPPASVLAAGGFAVPGRSAAERDALGVLHANCGHCHSPGPSLTCHNQTMGGSATEGVALRLFTTDTDPTMTAAYLTNVDVPLNGNNWVAPNKVTARIVPGDPAASAVWHRMNLRGLGQQMPPGFTNTVDTAGTESVSAWITELPNL